MHKITFNNRSRLPLLSFYFPFHCSPFLQQKRWNDRKYNVRWGKKKNITRPVIEPCALSVRILDPLDTLGPSRVARSDERKKKGRKRSIDRQIYARGWGGKKKGGKSRRDRRESAEEVLTW